MLSKDYSREFKEAFARRYSEGATITALVKEFGMTKSSVKLWRERIDQGGVDTIDRPSKNKTYSQEFKLEVVRAFMDGEGGYRELALEYGVRNSPQIRDWVNRYLEGGEGHGQGIPLTLPINQQKAVHAVQTDSKISEGLYRRLGKDTADLKRKITSQVSRSMVMGESYGQCAQALERQTEIGFNRAARIARTEGHRIQVTAAMDALYDAREAGADVVKQWDATLDKRTRRSHARCDGEIREIDDTFGNGLMCPGDPKGPASEVVNCRCALLQRARWALDESELATLKERAEFYGLDKTSSFEEFKELYLEVTEAHDVPPVTEWKKLANPKHLNRIEVVDDRKRARRKGESGAVKRNAIGATYSEIFKARDEEVERADLNKIKQTQLVHIPGTKQNRQAAKNRGIEPSCFTISIDEIKELIRKHAGHGIPDNLYGYKWNRKENCTADHVIGYIINQDGDKVPTRCFKIHYSDSGVHAVPRFDKGGEPDDV